MDWLAPITPAVSRVDGLSEAAVPTTRSRVGTAAVTAQKLVPTSNWKLSKRSPGNGLMFSA